MANMKHGDHCKDCKHCKIWSTDRNKATCTLHHEEGFHPDRGIPGKCHDKVSRRF